ncbi:hypothetical protein TNCV_1866411 [Trichonephila clavipes]|nr:hypothetical protein TNCV_1866411 [Trichonephila clavipes]
METFRKCKQACVDALKQMPDQPRGAILRSSAHGAARDRRNHLHGDKEEITIVTPNKFNIPKELQPNNVENPGSTTDERNTNSQRVENGSTNQVPAQNQLPAPIMLFIDEELSYKAQMAAISKEFPKIRSRLTGEYLKLYTDTAEERRSAVQLLKN